MRLIDATALKRKVLEWMPSDPCGREEKEHPFETDIVVSLMMEIEEAPTIENRPQGEWVFKTDIPIRNGASSAGYVCSVCGCDVFRTEGMNFCPNCGAKMDGDTGESR